MYYIEIVLNCADIQKLVQTISLNNVSTMPNNAPFPNAVFMAVSGLPYSINIASDITASDCSGPNGSISLNVSGSSSPYSYSWNTNPVQTNSTATGLAPGSYTCTITDANGCTNDVTETVALNDNSAVTAMANPAATCPGSPVQLSANVTAGILTDFTWTPGNLNNQVITVSPTTSTTYTVTATNSIGCSASSQVSVTVNPVPNPPLINDQTICTGTQATLTVQSPQAGYTYNWYDAATGGNLLSTGTSYTTPVLTNTTTYYAEAVNTTGCISGGRSTVTVTVSALPTEPSVNDISICPGTDASLSVINPQSGITYNWYDAATGGNQLGSGISITLPAVTSNTVVYAEAVNVDGCISATRTIVSISMLDPYPAPFVTVTHESFNAVIFSWNPVPGASGYEVSTDGGNTFQPPSSGTNGTTHTIAGLNSNTTVTLWVRTLGQVNCETSVLSDPVSGTTLGTQEVFVPNTFTPNGDGKNDILYVYGNYIASIQLRIFNQWGELIFVSENPGNGWDGTHSGKPQPVGVYAYILKVVRQDGTIVNKKGSISLIR
ncbi:MAG: gliding motility-associated C-terminal domain-containing protein [Chitinophagales bacterium]|nr:gliding motility-associated C-terminal domain-containing protein [Chitinophagales bacterium]